MKLRCYWGLSLLTVWACSGTVINDGPEGASGQAGRGASESDSDAGEPAGGSDASAGSAAAGESEAEVGGESGAPGHVGGNGGSAVGGDGGNGPGSGGAASCDFGTIAPTDEQCSEHLESGFDDTLGKSCESYGGSATLAQLVGTWVYFRYWDTQETLRIAADGSATFTSFQEGIQVLTDTITSEAIGSVDVSDASIDFKITDETLSLPRKPPRHESVSKTLHYWYRYDAKADLLTLALCGSFAGTFER